MASKGKRSAAGMGQVRIPGRFLSSLDELFESLGHRIVEKAVVEAFARKGGPVACRVVADDLLNAAEALMPSAIPELQNLLKRGETSHAQRKAS